MTVIVLNEKQPFNHLDPLWQNRDVETKIIHHIQNNIYAPLHLIDEQFIGHTFCLLEAYPFYTLLKECVSKEHALNGVIRYRRCGPENLLVEDIVALSKLLGSCQQMTVKQRTLKGVSYMIVLCKFGDSVIAHLEYWQQPEEHIELELSTAQQIFDFNSKKAAPSDDHSALELSLQTILQASEPFNTSLYKYYQQVKEQIGR